jgi:hypothetical protein
MTIELKTVPTIREITNRSWMEQATCRGVDTQRWFLSHPPKHVRRHIARVCSNCPMTRLCLSFALVNNEEFGAWGGYLASDLEPLRRRFASGEPLRSLLSGIPHAGMSRDSDAA